VNSYKINEKINNNSGKYNTNVVSKKNVRPTCMYKEHKTNDQVLCEANTYKKLFDKIKQRQCRFLGHMICGEGMENLVTTGKILGKRDRCRQKRKKDLGLRL
jgi:hypothetical protein